MVLGLLVVSLGWVVVRGLLARRELTLARGRVDVVRSAALKGDAANLDAQTRELQRRTRHARDLTGDVVWRAYAHVPLLGRTLRSAHDLTVVADQLTHDAMPLLVRAASTLSPRALRVAGDQVDIAPLHAAPAQLDAALAAIQRTASAAEQVQTSLALGAVGDARRELLDELTGLRTSLTTVRRVVDIAPELLGEDGVRRYFLAFQNLAETRGSGGLVGSYGILAVDHGRMKLEHIGPNSELKADPRLPPVKVAAEYSTRYGRFSADR